MLPLLLWKKSGVRYIKHSQRLYQYMQVLKDWLSHVPMCEVWSTFLSICLSVCQSIPKLLLQSGRLMHLDASQSTQTLNNYIFSSVSILKLRTLTSDMLPSNCNFQSIHTCQGSSFHHCFQLLHIISSTPSKCARDSQRITNLTVLQYTETQHTGWGKVLLGCTLVSS